MRKLKLFALSMIACVSLFGCAKTEPKMEIENACAVVITYSCDPDMPIVFFRYKTGSNELY
jgi:hypothetical protein